MKQAKESVRYEAIPATMVLPSIPILADGVPQKAQKEVLVRGVKTVRGSVARSLDHAQELLRDCQQRVRNSEPSAVLKLLDTNPEFVVDPWVRQSLARLATTHRLRRSPGRPRGRYRMHPLMVVALVEQLISAGRARNRDQAFGELDQLGVLPYETAKALFYQALGEKRFESVMLAFPEFAREISAEQAVFPHGTEVLQPDGKITRNVEHSLLGNVEVVFEAIAESA